MRRAIGISIFVAAAAIAARPAEAFTVRACGRDACHEEMTRAAGAALLASGFDAEANVPAPGDGSWREVASYLGDDLFEGAATDAERFLLYSLVLGARFPDLRGTSATDIQSLREIHRDPEGQDAHFLRAIDHDGAAGDAAAIEAGAAYLRGRLLVARDALARPRDEQVVTVDVFVELYGEVPTPVWEPGYELGAALHTLEDSFSHTVRSDDLRRVRQVANYIEAITYDYDEARDGIRHSWAMDRCRDEAADLAAAASPAFAELAAGLASAKEPGWPDPWLGGFLERWMTLEPGCDAANDYCGSRWAKLARTDPSLPIWEDLFGCGAAPGGARSGGVAGAALVALLLVALWVRRRARRAR